MCPTPIPSLVPHDSISIPVVAPEDPPNTEDVNGLRGYQGPEGHELGGTLLLPEVNGNSKKS